MGMPGPFTKSCYTNYQASAPNSNKWVLIDRADFENGYVLKVMYNNCTNFEGMKVMVYCRQYLHTSRLDPHFANNNTAPIARFKPDNNGWKMAITLAKSL